MFRSVDLLNLLEDFGEDLTLRVKSFGTYNVSTGSVTGTTETTRTVRGYFFNYQLNEIDGDNIVRGDRRLVLPTVDTSNVAIPEPDINDEVSGQGDKVTIVSVDKIMSNFSPVCYVCQVRE